MPSGTRFAKPSPKNLYGPAARRAREAALDRVAAASRVAKTGRAPRFDVAQTAQEEAEAAAYAKGLAANRRAHQKLLAENRTASADLNTLRTALATAEAALTAATCEVAERRTAQADAEAEAAALRLALDTARADTAALSAACAALEARIRPAAPPPEAVPRVVLPAPAAPIPETSWIGGPPPRSPSAILGRAPAPVVAHPPAPVATPVPVTARPDPLAAQPRPTPARPAPLQAATGRGRVDLGSPLGALLIQAPPPGGHGALCFAELLDRAAPRLLAPPPEAEAEDDGPLSRQTLGALRHDHRPTEDLKALACLYRNADRLYPSVALRPSDGLPLRGEALRAVSASGGSSAQACVEAL